MLAIGCYGFFACSVSYFFPYRENEELKLDFKTIEVEPFISQSEQNNDPDESLDSVGIHTEYSYNENLNKTGYSSFSDSTS